MKKKFIFLTIMGTYLFFILSAPIGLAISSQIEFEIVENEIVEPIKPSESKVIDFKVKFKLDLGSIGKMFYLNRRIGRILAFGFFQLYFFKFLKQIPPATLNLTVQAPNWCEAELNNYEVELSYNNEFEEADVKLSFTIDEDAPALKEENILIKADYLGVGTISPSFNSTNISFMPAYISNISVDTVTNFTIPPLKETMIPVNITNNGNGECSVNILGFEQSDWNITTVQDNIIGIGETKKIMIVVTPPKNFDNQSITFTFEPVSTVDDVNISYRQGTNVDFSITFYNDGSLKEDNEDIDITSIIIIAFVLIIILIIVFILLRKKE
ncbi:MAG: hypothetical protein JSU91_02240 [Thermoplasmatales archaeon]|nr:MAG: hypothetical protein JSU91_02240 [Thermoplasmatales archaeon]